ncbi:MAG: 2-vinyl bacteriochlorophyllide hydratase [Pseudomonadota bacterium]
MPDPGAYAGFARTSPLYSPAERARRDATIWTQVQAVLAPLQFVVFAVSLALVIRAVSTGEGYGLAAASILAKTAILYAIMITGAVWEKVVFGQYLFAPAFFWEDVVSMAVVTLHSAYVAMYCLSLGTPEQQVAVALAAYGLYLINAVQFVWKLRQARLAEGPGAPLEAGR